MNGCDPRFLPEGPQSHRFSSFLLQRLQRQRLRLAAHLQAGIGAGDVVSFSIPDAIFFPQFVKFRQNFERQKSWKERLKNSGPEGFKLHVQDHCFHNYQARGTLIFSEYLRRGFADFYIPNTYCRLASYQSVSKAVRNEFRFWLFFIKGIWNAREMYFLKIDALCSKNTRVYIALFYPPFTSVNRLIRDRNFPKLARIARHPWNKDFDAATAVIAVHLITVTNKQPRVITSNGPRRHPRTTYRYSR